MTKTPDDKAPVFGAGTVLRGNFAPRKSNAEGLAAPARPEDAAGSVTAEFERRARARIGGSIAFVSRIKDQSKDPLFWDGDDDAT